MNVSNVQELFEATQKHIDEVYHSPHTRRTYNRGLRNFQEYLELDPNAAVEAITQAHFTNYPNWLRRQDYAKRTIDVQISAMRILMNYMVNNDLIEFSNRSIVKLNEALKDLKRSREQPLPKVPRNGEVAKTIEAVSTRQTWPIQKARDLALVLVMQSSGLRVGEISNLKVGDVDLE